MYAKVTTICNQTGLHARPASDFVKAAIPFKSLIEVAKAEAPERRVNAKSLVLVLSLSAACGDQIEIRATGEDEQAAVEALAAVVDAGFGEKE